MRFRALILIGLTAMIGVVGSARSAPEEEESFGEKIKKFLAGPTPRPSPSSPDEDPTSAIGRTSDASPEPSLRRRKSQLSEPVRPISPGPYRKRAVSPAPRVKKKAPTPAESAVPTETPSPAPAADVSPGARRTVKGTRGPNATLFATEISGYEDYPSGVRKVLDLALSLTTQNLGYRYNSADPANGGMDCSGFVQYVLSKSGVPNVPRDARDQYIWVRKAGTFQAVLSHSDHSFELEVLKPGDLLFWAGTYQIDRDPSISQCMIYLGREIATNQRVMVGANDGRSYKGQTRFGVSIFDFRVSGAARKSNDSASPVFVGYGHIPDLPED